MISTVAPSDERARTLARWQQYLTSDGSLLGLRRFHESHRLVLLAHDPEAWRVLGRVVDDAAVLGLAATQARYARSLRTALTRPASRAQHLNVLEHAARSVLDLVSEDERSSWTRALRSYRRDDVGLAVPQDLLRTMLRRVAPRSWAARQAYLDPHPVSAVTD